MAMIRYGHSTSQIERRHMPWNAEVGSWLTFVSLQHIGLLLALMALELYLLQARIGRCSDTPCLALVSLFLSSGEYGLWRVQHQAQ